MLFVVSVTVMLVKATVIGGLQEGWKVAVTDSEKSALPFWTGKSPAALTLSLLTAFGWLPPPLMHRAVALRTTWIWASSPRPASLPVTVSVLPDADAWRLVSMKCGLPAHALGMAMTNAAHMPPRTISSDRRMTPPFVCVPLSRVCCFRSTSAQDARWTDPGLAAEAAGQDR